GDSVRRPGHAAGHSAAGLEGAGMKSPDVSGGIRRSGAVRLILPLMAGLMAWFAAAPLDARAQSLFERGGSLGRGVASREVSTRLIADTTAIQPGVPFRLGVHFSPEPEWHIYWRYAG